MPEQYTYLLVDFLCIVFPFAFSFHPKIRFYLQWRYFLLPCIATTVFFVLWDILFTYLGIWSFNPRKVCGLYLALLPAEEYLFFICIPYASVFTWYCLQSFFNLDKHGRAAQVFSLALIVFLLGTAAFNIARLYTSVTFILLALMLGLLLLRKVTFLPSFYIAFFLVLIPFFLSNGALTGAFTAQPVVSYNNAHNLGIRMITIPFEDTFYGMLLLLMNVAGFSYLRQRAAMQRAQSA